MGDPTVNRLQELASFIKLLDLACSSESRVLVIEEASGRGKSRLIQRFKEVCYERAAALSSVDLVGGSLSPIDILKRMAHDLEDIRFERCWNVLNKRGVANLQVGIDGNKILGSATLNVDSCICRASNARGAKAILERCGARISTRFARMSEGR